MSDLLAHAEVNSGCFYHFLLREALQMYLAALRPVVVTPAFDKTDDPLERIFAILAGYRERILITQCTCGCPLRRLAREIDPENGPAHKLIAENFQGWIQELRECIEGMRNRIRPETDPEALATYVLAVMEGGVMIPRSYGSVEPFDRSIAQLREHFRRLLALGDLEKRSGRSSTRRTSSRRMPAGSS